MTLYIIDYVILWIIILFITTGDLLEEDDVLEWLKAEAKDQGQPKEAPKADKKEPEEAPKPTKAKKSV